MAAEVWLAHLKTAGSATLWALGWVLRICYLITIPLHYPLYYAFRSVVFLLSPIWCVFGAIASAAGLVVNFVVRLKLAYAAIIGLITGCVLYGTSNFIFVLLGVDSSSAQEKKRRGFEGEDEDDGDIELEFWSTTGGGTTSTTTTTTTASPENSRRRSTMTIKSQKEPAATMTLDQRSELFDNKWKQLRASASEKPITTRRRRRGLLAQTIHEESSESDSL